MPVIASDIESIAAGLVVAEPLTTETQENSHARTLPPVSSIPSEILAMILDIAARSDPAIPTSALKVSHFWHDTAMNAAGLWTTINIGPGVERAAAYLARSRGSLLDIVIRLDSVGIQERCLPFCGVLCRDMERMRTLLIATDGYDILGSLLAVLPAAAPSLTSLDITVRGGAPASSWDGHTGQLFPAGAPHLIKLGLSGISIGEIAPPLSRIISFRLEIVRISVAPKDILQRLPALSYFQSYGSYAEIRRAPHHAIRVYADIESIGVDTVLLFALADPPVALALYEVHAHDMYSVLYLAHAPRSACFDNIRTLELYDCSMPIFTEEPPAFICGLTALTALVLEYHESCTWFSSLVVQDMPEGRQHINVDIIHNLVRGRAQAGMPLETLALLQSHCNAIGQAALLELRREVSLETIDD